jgi:hypothetical protein
VEVREGLKVIYFLSPRRQERQGRQGRRTTMEDYGRLKMAGIGQRSPNSSLTPFARSSPIRNSPIILGRLGALGVLGAFARVSFSHRNLSQGH